MGVPENYVPEMLTGSGRYLRFLELMGVFPLFRKRADFRLYAPILLDLFSKGKKALSGSGRSLRFPEANAGADSRKGRDSKGRGFCFP